MLWGRGSVFLTRSAIPSGTNAKLKLRRSMTLAGAYPRTQNAGVKSMR